MVSEDAIEDAMRIDIVNNLPKELLDKLLIYPICNYKTVSFVIGANPVYGILAGQGNHSLSTADVDGDGCQKIIYGGATIDHDGSILYSSYDYLPNRIYAKLGYGDAIHVAKIDQDRPGYEIFNVFEGSKATPYGFALRDTESGEVLFGEYVETDLGRCMIGDINLEVRGLQVWVKDVSLCTGEILENHLLGTNQSIRW